MPPPKRASPSLAGALRAREELRDLQRKLATLRAQRDSLPVGELRTLAAAEAELDRTRAQRDTLAQRLADLPPARRRLGRLRDDHATERARLTAAVDAANDQLVAQTTGRGPSPRA